jgi:hypothetical protein
MKPVINLDEQVGKVVGKRRPPSNSLAAAPAQTIADSRAWAKAFPRLRVRRGVYRFRTHEEADAWLWKLLTQRPT